MTTLTWDRHRGHAWSYDVVDLGYNYRIDELRAALGRTQLRKLEQNNQKRRELARFYQQMLTEQVPEIIIPFEHHPGTSTCHIMPILLPEGTDRARFAQGMKNRQVQTSLHYPPIHLFEYYRINRISPPTPLPLTEQVAAREVTLPLYPSLTPTDIEYVVQSVCESLKEAREKVTEGAESA
jgi:dTDP-4-amino-4,6-dideoxygalactose transaminase